MKLEEAISQDSFPSEQQKLLINLLYTHSWVVSQLKSFLSNYNLTIQQFNILRILRGQHPNPATVNLLRERMLDKMSDASRVVERLRVKGYLERKKSREDRRTVEVKINQAGLDILDRIDKNGEFFDNLLANLPDEEAKTMNAYLDQIRG